MDRYELLGDVSMAVFVIAILLRILQSVLRPPMDIDTLEEYVQRHPDCYRNGRVFCYRCGSNSIYLYRWGIGRTWIQNLHVCRQCGAKLYRSKIVL